MILLCDVVLVAGLNDPNITKYSASFCFNGEPIDKIKVGNKEVFSNYLLENDYVHLYSSFSYGQTDLTMPLNTSSTTNSDYTYDYDSYLTNDTLSGNKYTRRTAARRPEMVNNLDYGRSRPGEWPKPILFNTKGGNKIVFYNNSNYTDPVYEVTFLNKNILFVYNLIPSKKYYYRIYNNSTVKRSGNFTTEGKIRMIRLEGVRNVRDCGGHKTKDGSLRIKYGLLYRGGLFHPTFYNNNSGATFPYSLSGLYNATSNKYYNGGATANDIDEVLNKLKIRCDLDLRDYTGKWLEPPTDPNASVNGNLNTTKPFFPSEGDNGVTYVGISSIHNVHTPSYTMLLSTGTTKTDYLKLLREFCKAVAEAVSNNKPVYVHCLQGADRTGIFILCLFALLNINIDGIIKNYELTSFWGSCWGDVSRADLAWKITYLNGSVTETSANLRLNGVTNPYNTAGENYIYDVVNNWVGGDSEITSYINTIKSNLLESVLS